MNPSFLISCGLPNYDSPKSMFLRQPFLWRMSLSIQDCQPLQFWESRPSFEEAPIMLGTLTLICLMLYLLLARNLSQ